MKTRMKIADAEREPELNKMKKADLVDLVLELENYIAVLSNEIAKLCSLNKDNDKQNRDLIAVIEEERSNAIDLEVAWKKIKELEQKVDELKKSRSKFACKAFEAKAEVEILVGQLTEVQSQNRKLTISNRELKRIFKEQVFPEVDIKTKET